MPRVKVHLAFQASVHTLYSNNKKWTFKIEHSHEIPCWQGVTETGLPTLKGHNQLAIYKQRVWTRYNQCKKQIQIAIGVGTRTWDCACRIVCLECWSSDHATSFSWVYCAGLIHGLLLGVGLTLSTSHMQWSVSYTYYVRVNFFCPYQRDLNRQSRPSSLIYSYGAEKYLLFLVCKQPLLRETRCGAFLFI